MEKKITYYLFGSEAVRIYLNEDADAIIEQYESGEFTERWKTFEFTEGETSSIDLMCAFDGFNDYAIITKSEYDKL
jgi:hypothetical protein